MRYDLDSGAWVEMTPIQGLKNKHRSAFDGAPRLFFKFKDDGSPDMSEVPISMSIAIVRRDALFSRLVTAWSFTDDNGNPLPVPYWDGVADKIQDLDSIGEIPIDDANQLWDEIMVPYIEKCSRKADPKGTTTEGSNGSSKVSHRSSRTG